MGDEAEVKTARGVYVEMSHLLSETPFSASLAAVCTKMSPLHEGRQQDLTNSSQKCPASLKEVNSQMTKDSYTSNVKRHFTWLILGHVKKEDDVNGRL